MMLIKIFFGFVLAFLIILLVVMALSKIFEKPEDKPITKGEVLKKMSKNKKKTYI